MNKTESQVGTETLEDSESETEVLEEVKAPSAKDYPPYFLLPNGRHHLENLKKETTDVEELNGINQKLSFGNVIPKEQDRYFLPGNGGLVTINGKQTFVYIDGVAPHKAKLATNTLVVTVHSLFGDKLTGKKVGEEGKYTSKGKLFKFKVDTIVLPSQAKSIFRV